MRKVFKNCQIVEHLLAVDNGSRVRWNSTMKSITQTRNVRHHRLLIGTVNIHVYRHRTCWYDGQLQATASTINSCQDGWWRLV